MRTLIGVSKKASLIWTPLCQISLDATNIAFTNSPIFIFPYPNQHYVLYTDVSKHSCPGVLTQRKVVQTKGKETTSFLPITYINDTFVGSQKN